MKSITTIIVLMFLVGCTSTSEKGMIQSAESEIIGTLTNNGCLISHYEHMSKVGHVVVECK